MTVGRGSVVHRAPVTGKLLALAAVGLAAVVLHGPVQSAAMLGAVAACAAVAQLPWRSVAAGLRPILLAVVLLGAVQWWQSGWRTAVQVAADLLALVLAATVLTATTRTDDLLDALVRAAAPLRRIGLDPQTLGLAIALMLRTIPALLAMWTEVRDAARARGLERDPRALLVPAAVRSVARARSLGDALAARGIGEEPDPEPGTDPAENRV